MNRCPRPVSVLLPTLVLALILSVAMPQPAWAVTTSWLHGQVSSIQSQIKGIKGVDTSQSKSLTGLAARVTGVEAAGSALGTRLGRVETTQGLLVGQVAGLSSGLASMQTLHAGQSASLAALESRVLSVETSASAFQTLLTQLRSDLTSALDTVTSLASQVARALSRITSLENNTYALASTLGNLSDRVASVEATIPAQVSTVSSLRSELATVEAALTAARARIDVLEARSGSASTFWPDVSIEATDSGMPLVQLDYGSYYEPGRSSAMIHWIAFLLNGRSFTPASELLVLHLPAGDVVSSASPFVVPYEMIPPDGTPVTVEYWVEAYSHRLHGTLRETISIPKY